MTVVVVYPKASVVVDGDEKTVLDTQTTVSLRSPISVSQVTVNHDDGGFEGTEKVQVVMGDQTGMQQVADGFLNVDSMSYAPGQANFSTQGILYLTQEATGIIDETATPETLPDDPPYQGPLYTKMWVEETDGTIVTDILAAYGITNVSIDDSGTVFGTIKPVRWQSDQPGWALIEELDNITGRKTFVSSDGVVTRIEYSGLPSGSSSMSFTEGTNLRNIQRQRTTGKVYNSVKVTGATGIQAPDGVYYDISAIRDGTSKYIPNPPGTRQFTFSSELIETEELAGDVADRLLRQLNRRTETITGIISPGNRKLQAAMTVALTAPSVKVNTTFATRVLEVRQIFGAKDYITQVVFESALAEEGTDPNQKPVAVITYLIEQEYTVSGQIFVVVLDGSTSYDLDGAVVDYEWEASAGTLTVDPSGKSAVLIIPGPWSTPEPTVTLTVTDDHGKHGTKTVTIHKTVGNTYERDLWVAATTKLLLSLDGQKHWTEFDVPALYIPPEAGNTYQLAATDTGVLYRVTTGKVTTLPTGPTNVRCLFITRDRNGTETGVAWAGTTNGDIWRSPDYGVTWFLAGSLGTGIPVYAITESPFSSGDLYALGANRLYHSYDNAATWAILYTHPNSGVFANRLASGITENNLQLHWVAFYGPTMLADASHLHELADTINIDTSDAGNKPLRFTGLTLSLDSQTLYAVDISSGGNGRAWVADATASGNLVAKTWDDGEYGNPTHCVRDGKFPVIWGSSVDAVWKSVTGFASFIKIRALTGGLVGSMIAYGKIHPPTIVVGSLCFLAKSTPMANDCHLIALTQNGWEDRGDVGMSGSHTTGVQYHFLKRTLEGTLLAWHWDRGFSNFGVRRSTDEGETWSDVADLTDAMDIVQSGDGTLFAYGNRYNAGGSNTNAKIMTSTDDGVTWTEVSDWLFNDGSVAANVRIAVDFSDSTRLVMMTINGAKVSVDGGGTFGATDYGFGIMGGNGDAGWAVISPSANHYANRSHNLPGIVGGTISPHVFTNITSGTDIGRQEFAIRFSDTMAYFLDSAGADPSLSVDGGATWVQDGTYGAIKGVAHDAQTEDMYYTYSTVSGTGLSGDPYLGLVVRVNGGIGTPDDLTQSMVDDLGALWYPYFSAVVK